MATIQARQSRGHTYWYIVESRRVNGKPRPITLAYLGKPEDLLLRLKGLKEFKVRSFSHGDTACLLNLAEELDIVNIINKHVVPSGSGNRPIRDGLTVGATILLGAIGRACHPCSKRSWHTWAKRTSLEYSLRTTLKGLDSQHFWDQMDVIPVEEISKIEKEIVEKVLTRFDIALDCLFLDATNFFTFIDSTNHRCTIAQRGKNKQKRMDLRQFGLALLVTRQEQLPLFHRVYTGNEVDVTMFEEYFSEFKQRIEEVAKGLESVTLIFDRGNNSKKNFARLDDSQIHYVASLTPAHHKRLIQRSKSKLSITRVGDEEILTYRTKAEIWGKERTVIVLVSETLREGQVRGIVQHLEKAFKGLEELKAILDRERTENRTREKRTRQDLEQRVSNMLNAQFINKIVSWRIDGSMEKGWKLRYRLDEKAFHKLKEEELGRRILTTDRHQWSTEEIIRAYRGQSNVERVFKNIKNPFHDAVRPQFHWTDQKIEVHVFMCVLAYLLTSLALKLAREKAAFRGDIHTLMEELRSIRLSTQIEQKQERQGKPRVTLTLEDMDDEIERLSGALKITNDNIRSGITVGVYADERA
jgi:transposase